jgi:hypothetical protein
MTEIQPYIALIALFLLFLPLILKLRLAKEITLYDFCIKIIGETPFNLRVRNFSYVLAVGFVIFNDDVLMSYDDKIVPLLSKISPSLWLSLLAVLLFFYCVHNIIENKLKGLGFYLFWPLLFVLVLYIKFRLTDERYEFTTAETIISGAYPQAIVYADVIAGYFGFRILITIGRFFHNFICKPWRQVFEETQGKAYTNLLEDNPLNFDTQQKIISEEWKLRANQVVDVVSNQTAQQAFAIGIKAPWGGGKSSFMNVLKGLIQKKGIITIDFFPWTASQGKIQEDFLKVLSEKVFEKDTILSEQLLSYSEKLFKDAIGVSIPLLSWVNIFIPSAVKLKAKVQNRIKHLDKPIVVFMDDLDRLEKNEILDALKLIRDIANFPKLFFLVGYDTSRVSQKISSNEYPQKISSNEYLQKIFQLEINLPPYDVKYFLTSFTVKVLKEWGDTHPNLDLNNLPLNAREWKTSSGKTSLIQIGEYFDDFRSLKRFLNLLYLNLTYTQDFERAQNLRVQDVFYLTIVECVYPSIWKQLKKRDIIISKNKDAQTPLLITNQTQIILQEQNARLKFEHKYEDEAKPKFEALIKLLKLMFPEEYEAINGINTVTNYTLYIGFESKEGISMNRLEAMLKERDVYEQIQEVYEKLSDVHQDNLYDQLSIILNTNREYQKDLQILKSIFWLLAFSARNSEIRKKDLEIIFPTVLNGSSLIELFTERSDEIKELLSEQLTLKNILEMKYCYDSEDDGEYIYPLWVEENLETFKKTALDNFKKIIWIHREKGILVHDWEVITQFYEACIIGGKIVASSFHSDPTTGEPVDEYLIKIDKGANKIYLELVAENTLSFFKHVWVFKKETNLNLYMKPVPIFDLFNPDDSSFKSFIENSNLTKKQQELVIKNYPFCDDELSCVRNMFPNSVYDLAQELKQHNMLSEKSLYNLETAIREASLDYYERLQH